MKDIEKTISFRNSEAVHCGYWEIGDESAYGSLRWVNEAPKLTIILRRKFDISKFRSSPTDYDDPMLKKLKPPSRIDVIGTISGYGIVTLEKCFLVHSNISTNYNRNEVFIEITLQMHAIWMGAVLHDINGKIKCATIHDKRIGGFFGNSSTKTIYKGNDNKEAFDKLDDPICLMGIYNNSLKKIQLGDSDFFLSVGDSFTGSFSATLSKTISASKEIIIEADKDCTIEELEHYIFNIENMLSVFSLERIRFEHVSFEHFNPPSHSKITKVWRLKDEFEFTPPMHHQILIDFTNRIVLESLFRNWFQSNRVRELSIWIFMKSLSETEDSVARFTLVCQAFEVLGRDLLAKPMLSKGQMKKAASAIENALEGEFEKDFVDRVKALVSSSNRASFKSVLEELILPVIKNNNIAYKETFDNICKRVSDVRNTLIHMSDDGTERLNLAFSNAGKLSLLSCFLYSIIIASQFEIPVHDINAFLLNNRTSRHGLPNDILSDL